VRLAPRLPDVPREIREALERVAERLYFSPGSLRASAAARS
jgi:hypothetical protein